MGVQIKMSVHVQALRHHIADEDIKQDKLVKCDGLEILSFELLSVIDMDTFGLHLMKNLLCLASTNKMCGT